MNRGMPPWSSVRDTVSVSKTNKSGTLTPRLETHQNAPEFVGEGSTKKKRRKRRKIENKTQGGHSAICNQRTQLHGAFDGHLARHDKSNTSERCLPEFSIIDKQNPPNIAPAQESTDLKSHANTRKRKREDKEKSSHKIPSVHKTTDATSKDGFLPSDAQSGNAQQNHQQGSENKLSGTSTISSPPGLRTNERKKAKRQAAESKAQLPNNENHLASTPIKETVKTDIKHNPDIARYSASSDSSSTSSSEDSDDKGARNSMEGKVNRHIKASTERQPSMGSDFESSYIPSIGFLGERSQGKLHNYYATEGEDATAFLYQENRPRLEFPALSLHDNFTFQNTTQDQMEKTVDYTIRTHPKRKYTKRKTPKYVVESGDEEALPKSKNASPKVRAKAKPAANRIVGLQKLGEFDAEDRAAVTAFERYYCGVHGLSDAELTDRIHRFARNKDGREFWREFADNIPGRKIKAVQRFCRNERPPPGIITSPMTAADDEELLRLVEKHGTSWEKIGREMNRMAEKIRDHYRNVLKDKNTRTTVRWTTQEDECLKQAVGKVAAIALEKNPDTDDVAKLFNFVVVSKEMGLKRTRYQTARRWNSLLRKGRANLAEEVKLAAERLGLNIDPSLIDRVALNKYAEDTGSKTEGEEHDSDAAIDEGSNLSKKQLSNIKNRIKPEGDYSFP